MKYFYNYYDSIYTWEDMNNHNTGKIMTPFLPLLKEENVILLKV